jgi:alpha-tubulin suppressor-like RCC1 family protein
MGVRSRPGRGAGAVLAAAGGALAMVLAGVAGGGPAEAATGPAGPGPVHLPGPHHAGLRAQGAGRRPARAGAQDGVSSVLGWGQDSYGQLGNGASPATQSTPVAASLPSGTDVTQVSAGYDHSLAVTSAGGVLAFGHNDAGQLGNGTTTGSDTPVAVSLPSGFKADTLAAGEYHALALPAPVPQVTAISSDFGLPAGGGTVTITGSGFTGATAVDFGTVKASSFTVVNDGEITAKVPAGTRLVNISVTALGGTSATSAADEFTYLAQGSVLEWGNNGSGQLGDAQYSNAVTPVAALLPAGTVVTAVARGGLATYALTSAGTVYAWGNGADGELGNGTTADYSQTPVKVSIPAGTVVKAITANFYGGYALTSTGQVLAWGYGSYGELGNGTTTSSDVPVAVSLTAGTTVTSLSGEFYGALVLTSAGKVYAWGYGGDGELGDGTTTNSDVPVAVSIPSGTKVTAVSGEYFSGLALTSSGKILAWGFNGEGDLGDATTTDSDVPVDVSLPAGVSATQLGPNMDDGGTAVVSPVTTVTGVSPSSGKAGITVTINGLNLKGAAKVLFGSAAATFTVNSATKITATVPAGSGKVAVTVTTPLGTAAKTCYFTYSS